MKQGNITPFRNDIALFLSCRDRHADQHVFHKDPVAHGGIVDQHVGDCSHDLAVLDDRRAAHECGQEGTTIFRILYDIDR